MTKTDLPINDVIPSIKTSLENNTKLIVQAPPGAGKSTIIPISLISEPFLNGKKILVLEPRRVAAKSIATQMSKLLNKQLGDIVGYHIRLERKVSKNTKILVVTEGILTKMLQNDEALEDIGCVVFDEFHERSIHTDLGLALCLQTQEILREDLRLLVMSATLNTEKLSEKIDAKVITSKSRNFDVKQEYLPLDIKHPTKDELPNVLVNTVIKALDIDKGDILVFIPEVKMINKVMYLLEQNSNIKDVLVLPLHSTLSFKEQALALNKNEKRKVILATNIAQTSLTIENIKVVIDTGLQKIQKFNHNNMMNFLELDFISKDDEIQREGRAGRLSNGKCYKLWHKRRLLQESTKPEILRVDLTDFLLNLSFYGVESLDELIFLDKPPKQVIKDSKLLLKELGLINSSGNITKKGKTVVSIGTSPRFGFMILEANRLGFAKEACIVAAILSENSHNLSRLKSFEDYYIEVKENKNSRFKLIHKQANIYLRRLEKVQEINQKKFKTEYLGLIVLFAYLDRLAKKKESFENQYLLSNKKSAILYFDEPIKEDYIVVPSLTAKETNSYINSYIKVEFDLIKKYLSGYFKTVIEIDTSKSFEFYETVYFKAIKIDSKKTDNIPKEKWNKALLNYISNSEIEKLFNIDKKSFNLIKRVEFYNTYSKDKIENISLKNLKNSVDKWLQPYLFSVKKIDDLKKINIFDVLTFIIGYENVLFLDEFLPETIVVPSGSKIKLHYESDEVIMKVKIQEVFGLYSTYKVLNNKIPVTIHLLNPANRPIQITKDIKSFWDNSYEEVRKELRGKYKKHYWPQSPYEAIATNKTKKQMK